MSQRIGSWRLRRNATGPMNNWNPPGVIASVIQTQRAATDAAVAARKTVFDDNGATTKII